ncbi:MAG: prephenate dehydratase, partial [Myxococcota bacterium]
RSTRGARGRRVTMSDRDRKTAQEGASEISPELARLRDQIDVVDREILAKLNERARLVQRVGDLKRSRRAPVYVASRERDLVEALAGANEGPFPDAGIAHVFREIISATRSLEEIARVAFLGPEGTFSHQAAVRQFGALVELAPAHTIRDVFEWVERGDAHYGVVPVENTTEGAVTQTYDALVESDVTLCGELLLDVSLDLMSQGRELSEVRRLASHPQPLAQCRDWIHRRLPGIETIETASTVAAAELAVRDPEVAAIGSAVAAEAHGLSILERGIEDRRGNATRFLVIGRVPPLPSRDDLTSAVFTVRKDQSGTLYHLLEPFARYGVNLSAIQSRPMKGKPWEYLFFVDMEGHISDDAVGKALDEAAATAHSHKVLGSYPRAARPGVREGKRD